MALTHKPKAEGFPPYAMALDTFAGVRAEMEEFPGDVSPIWRLQLEALHSPSSQSRIQGSR